MVSRRSAPGLSSLLALDYERQLPLLHLKDFEKRGWLWWDVEPSFVSMRNISVLSLHLLTHPPACMDFHTVCHDTCFLKRIMDVLMGIFGGSAAAPNGILKPFVQGNVSTSPTFSNEHYKYIIYIIIYIYTCVCFFTLMSEYPRSHQCAYWLPGRNCWPFVLYLAIVTACKSHDMP
jgi:hypothetical protein